MKILKNQKGFSHLELILVIAVVVAIGLVGWRVLSHNSQTLSSNSGSSVPTQIKSKADLQAANKALDKTNVDGTVNPNSLSADEQAVL